LKKIHDQHGNQLPYEKAAAMVTDLVSKDEFAEFLTLAGYQQLA